MLKLSIKEHQYEHQDYTSSIEIPDWIILTEKEWYDKWQEHKTRDIISYLYQR